MLLGTLCKGLNALYFKNYLQFFFEMVTQVLLMVALFGFMDLMIIIKWTTNWADSATAPSVIQTLIVMFINMGNKPESDQSEDMINNQT